MNREATGPSWDCIIVGAGPAGLNAALVLCRASGASWWTGPRGAACPRPSWRGRSCRPRGCSTRSRGFEHRDERLAVLAPGDRGEHLAVLLRQWSDDVVLLSKGPHGLAGDQLARLQALGVPVIETSVAGLDGDDGRLRRVRLDDGRTLDRDARPQPLMHQPGEPFVA